MENIEEYKRMFLFMYRELIRHYDYFKSTHNHHKKAIENLLKKKKKKVLFEEYEFIRAQYSFYYVKIYNILGDFQEDAISYKKLTDKGYIKKFSLKINERPENVRALLNEYQRQRNWASHFSIADGRAKTQDLNIVNDNGQIRIDTPKYVDLALFIDLYHANQAELENIKLIEKYILDDYFSIFKKKIKVKRKKYRMIGTNALEISYKSYKYSKTSKHSKAKKK